MTGGEVCPIGAKSGRTQPIVAVLRLEARPMNRIRNSRFLEGANSASIGTEFGGHLGNVGSNPSSRRRHVVGPVRGV